MKSIFDKIDSQKWTFKGFSPFAVMQNAKTWRRYMLFCFVATVLCWAVFGWDSTWSMLQPYASNIGALLTGRISFAEVRAQSQVYYGVGNHFSAPVIYSIAFITLSLHFEKYGITKSRNFFATTSLSLMSIGIFELIYNVAYANFQNQPWTMAFVWKQVTNLVFFIMFTVVGVLTLVYLYTEGYRLNFGKRTKVLSVIAIALWLTWIFYPFPVDYITVATTAGDWTNTAMFPQTMYAIDMDPLDGLAIGVPFFIENNLLHAVNTFAKMVSATALLSLCCGRVIQPHRRELKG